MYGPNDFAVLTPKDAKNLARTAFRLPENKNRFYEATGGVVEEPTIDSREPTPALLFSEEEVNSVQNAPDRIILTFDEGPKNPLRGWQFGTSKKSSDILLGNRGTEGISAQQFHITVNEDGWIFLYDDRSSHGTAVGYDHQKKDEIRRKWSWILSHGPGSQVQWEDVTIHAGDLVFKIEFPNQKAGQSLYRDNLKAFFKQSQAALPSIGTLDFDSFPPTATPSQPQSPSQRPIYLYQKAIGSGGFGEVYPILNTRNGVLYAAKIFKHSPGYSGTPKKRKRGERLWKDMIQNEIDIMRKSPHPNVMPVLNFHWCPKPTLIMPYYHDGHLGDHINHLSKNHRVSAFRQMLLGLSHLHGLGIVHRDLKPENLLVELNQSQNKLALVIADFGLSKMLSRPDDLLGTFCGTRFYAAPDILPIHGNGGYGAKVDIWAAGVIMLQCICGLPEAPDLAPGQDALEEWIWRWNRSLVNTLYEADKKADMSGDQVMEVVRHMIDLNPETRYSADESLEAGCRNGVFKEGESGNIMDKYDVDTSGEDTALAQAADTSPGTDTGGKGAPSLPMSKLPETDTNNAPTVIAEYFWDESRAGSNEESRKRPLANKNSWDCRRHRAVVSI